ncbi:MAG TPA: hypothetical protein DCZ12_02085 [Gammaproteobacteria bacterium]|nr:hypothetical protein [Gammaproteobacteria bacterium]
MRDRLQLIEKAYLYYDREFHHPIFTEDRVIHGENIRKAKSKLYRDLLEVGYIDQFSDMFDYRFQRAPELDLVKAPSAPVFDLLTEKQKHIICHANGNSSDSPGFRDYYCTRDGDPDCERLVELELMKYGRTLNADCRYYILSESGAAAALSDAKIPRRVARQLVPKIHPLAEKGMVSLESIEANPSLIKEFSGLICRIYSNEWFSFWRQNGCGYGSRSEAGIYQFEDAYLSTNHCGPEKKIWYEFVESEQEAA